MTYYPYWYRLNEADAYLIWYTTDSVDGADANGVLLDDGDGLLTFRSMADLQGYADLCGIAIEPEVNPEPLDLDTVQRWLRAARKTTIDSKMFLEAWNLFSDLASTVRGVRAHVDDQKENRIYEKLFWGSNLHALTPSEMYYEPTWTKSDVGSMRNVLNKGLNMFKSSLLSQPTGEAARL